MGDGATDRGADGAERGGVRAGSWGREGANQFPQQRQGQKTSANTTVDCLVYRRKDDFLAPRKRVPSLSCKADSFQKRVCGVLPGGAEPQPFPSYGKARREGLGRKGLGSGMRPSNPRRDPLAARDACKAQQGGSCPVRVR